MVGSNIKSFIGKHSTDPKDPPTTVMHGTKEYAKAYNDGTFAEVPNQLDEVHITGKKRKQPSLFEKAKTALNPKNWGVDDYTEKGDFGMAYQNARYDDQEEFMYENKRYNTKNSGTSYQQAKMYGNTNELDQKSLGILKKGTDQNYAWFADDQMSTESEMKDKALKQGLALSELAGNPSITDEKNPFLKMFDQEGRASYNPYKNQMSIPGDEFVMEGLLAEYSHAYAKKQEGQGTLDYVKDYLKSPFITPDGQMESYDRKGSFENDAHEVIEPVLDGFFYGDHKKEDVQPLIDFARNVNLKGKGQPANFLLGQQTITTRNVQEFLNRQGYPMMKSKKVYEQDHGDGRVTIHTKFDGKLGPETRSAMNDYNQQKPFVTRPEREKKEKKLRAHLMKVNPSSSAIKKKTLNPGVNRILEKYGTTKK